MRDIAYVVELAKSYDRAEITRDALQDQIHAVSLSVVQFGVIAFADEFGGEAAAAFVVAAELPLIVDADGFWSINEQDERVKDFPPEDL
jgi:NAD(P)H-hydrate repair Nnr-like enzyme with NAD(P)H-hydrate dehydratase domain